jgi:hypothetical protein
MHYSYQGDAGCNNSTATAQIELRLAYSSSSYGIVPKCYNSSPEDLSYSLVRALEVQGISVAKRFPNNVFCLEVFRSNAQIMNLSINMETMLEKIH